MHVGVRQVALQQITILILRPRAKIEFVEVFVANPRLAAEREVPVAAVQWDVFQPVQAFRPHGFIFQIAPVLIKSQRLKKGRRRCRRSRGQGCGRLRSLSESPYAYASECGDQEEAYDHSASYFDVPDARTTLKLKCRVPSTPQSRSQIGIICSVARAALMSPRSVTERQPNHCFRISVTRALAPASLPQTKMSWSPGTSAELTITSQFTVLSVLTTLVSGNVL